MIGKNLQDRIEKVYRLDEILGSGSYGVIFKAYRKEDNLPVAIKCFVSGEQIPQNCFNEIKLIFRIQNPYVIKALDVFFARRAYAIVFEFMNSGDLRQFMQSQRISLSQSFILISQIASGLKAIHKLGIIHRDLKPENILVHREKNQLIYKLADFNISRFAYEQKLKATDRGSPLYMAPEQFYDSYDHRADFYALGIIFYELVCGITPFLGSYQELMRQHIKTEINFDKVPVACKDIIEKMLQKKPDLRYQTSDDMLNDLNQALNQLSEDQQLQAMSSESEQTILTFDSQKQAFYLKYVDKTLWTEYLIEQSKT